MTGRYENGERSDYQTLAELRRPHDPAMIGSIDDRGMAEAEGEPSDFVNGQIIYVEGGMTAVV